MSTQTTPASTGRLLTRRIRFDESLIQSTPFRVWRFAALAPKYTATTVVAYADLHAASHPASGGWLLRGLWVEPGLRRFGIGSELVQLALYQAARFGAHTVTTLGDGPDQWDFLASCGFTRGLGDFTPGTPEHAAWLRVWHYDVAGADRPEAA